MSIAEQESVAQEKIKARAHEIWENEGRPEGRHLEHWRQAAEEVEAAEPPKEPSGPHENGADETAK